MKGKKKLALIMAGAMLVASLAGCGGGGGSAPAPAAGGDSAGGTAASEASGSSEAAELNIIIASNQTAEDNPYSFGMDKFKEVLEDISGGKVAVTVHKGTLGENESELIEKLEMGALDITVASPGFMTAIGVPEVDIFALNYLFDSFDHWEASVDGEFGDQMKEIVNQKTNNSFRILDYWTASVRDFYGKKKVVSPSDLKGMTVRIQSSTVQQKFWEACGAIPTTVAWGELYQALQQGVVDSAENDYTNFMLKDHHKTENGKFVSETHHDFTTRLLLISGNRYDALTDEQKAWIDEAAAAATQEEREVTYRMFEESKAKVIADGATVTNFDEMDIDAFKALALPIQDEFAADNNMTEQLELIRSLAP